MKNLFFIAATILVMASGYAQVQQPIFREINQLKASGAIPTEMQIVTFLSTDVHQRDYDLRGLTHGTIVRLSKDAIEDLLLNRYDFIKIPLPVDDRSEMTLTLKRNPIFTNDFTLYSSSDPGTPVTYTPGVHYKGIVDGEPTSVVALSVFKDQVMGQIASDQGNFVIGRINHDPENRHIFYNNKDLDAPFEFECGTPDDGLEYTKDMLENKLTSRDANDCVRLYIEVNNDIVTDKGGVGPATDFITGLYNQSFTIFANESINMMINEILAWTSPSPYHSGTAQQKLAAFKANTSFFNGDLAQLLGYSNDGVAGPNGICHVDPDMSKCYSGIHSFNANQSIIFICHELGHLLGSAHTHACVWNGNNTAIDGCATVEGNCPQPPPAPDWTGTLMSYCFPAFDPYDGFGPQPGNVIRNTVNASGNCLTACGPPSTYCLSYGLVSNNKYLKKVVLGSINNLSGNNNGYGNYLSKSTNLTAGNAYTISLTPGSNGGTKYWRVWIDYNGDNDWDDAGELVGQKTGSQVVSFAFTVPAEASLISTRMRVSMAYNTYASNCGSFPTGEVEDYTVVIQPAQGANLSTAIDHVTDDSRFLVAYPNPAQHEITLRNANFEKIGDIVMYDGTGRKILQRSVSASETIIDLTEWSAGIYFLMSDQSNMLKIIKL
jgi:GEVED domain/Secretion system C-terminal sorting domain/Metallo-peptidase family M12